jgi:hypothetical protein
MVPTDHAQLLEDADGDPSAVKESFRARFIAAGGNEQEAEQAYADRRC